MFKNPFKTLSKFEFFLWLFSFISVLILLLIQQNPNPYIIAASLIGVTALIFVSKGDLFGQFLTVVFSILYGIVSFTFHYYGEMITYLGMTGPIAFISMISWFNHPYKKGERQIEISTISFRSCLMLTFLSLIITTFFGMILSLLNTPNIVVSIISLWTSFMASGLVFLRSPFYGLAYATNDIVLIILWTLASFNNIEYIPMVLCFSIFLINDIYGFYNWIQIRNQQKEALE